MKYKELGNSPEPKNKRWKRALKGKSKLLVAETLRYIASVEYRVSLRWLFYRLLDDGILHDKEDYDPYKRVVGKARHSGYIPLDAIADEGRGSIPLSGRFGSVDDYSRWYIKDLRENFHAIDLQLECDPYIFLAYEAKAMSEQFRKYADPYGVRLFPFGGDPSIPFKVELAARIQSIEQDVVVIYFGDLDAKGAAIGESAMRDVRNWTGRDKVKAYLAGLTTEQAQAFDLLDNPERPGAFQWESLGDDQAQQLIESALDEFVDVDDVIARRAVEQKELGLIADHLEGIVQ